MVVTLEVGTNVSEKHLPPFSGLKRKTLFVFV
jgi:hypothetical protein